MTKLVWLLGCSPTLFVVGQYPWHPMAILPKSGCRLLNGVDTHQKQRNGNSCSTIGWIGLKKLNWLNGIKRVALSNDYCNWSIMTNHSQTVINHNQKILICLIITYPSCLTMHLSLVLSCGFSISSDASAASSIALPQCESCDMSGTWITFVSHCHDCLQMGFDQHLMPSESQHCRKIVGKLRVDLRS